jgi:flagellar biosynthetic protein FliP
MSCSAASRVARRVLALALVTLTLVLGSVAVAGAQPIDELVPPAAPAAPVAPTAPEAPTVDEVPSITMRFDDADQGLSRTVSTIVMLTVAALAPIGLMLMTSFTRFVVVLGLARQGLGLQTVPPAQVLVGLALFLALFSMAPTFSAVNETALQPLLAGEMDAMEAASVGYEPLRDFMLAQTREDDLRMFVEMSGSPEPASQVDIGPTTLIPAFVISELRTAFTIGFLVFVPFLIVDLVVAAILMSLGMVMLPPIFVSLPLKLLLFVLVDGWSLLSRSLVASVVGG